MWLKSKERWQYRDSVDALFVLETLPTLREEAIQGKWMIKQVREATTKISDKIKEQRTKNDVKNKLK